MANWWNCGDWWPYRGGEDFDGCLEWDDWQSTLECVVWFALLSAETWDQRTDCHSGTQIYVSLLQWKVSNHEVSLLCITSLGFWCAIIDWISKSITWRTEHNWSVIQRLNEAYQPSCDSIFPVCVQPHFDNQTSQKTRKLSQLNNGEGVQISLQVVNSSVTKDFIVCLQSSIATVQPAVTWNFTHHFNEQSLTNCCWNCEKAIVQWLFQASILHPLNSCRSANNLSSMLVRFLWLATEQQILICFWLVDLTAIEHQTVPTGEYLNKNCWAEHSGKAQNGGPASFEQIAGLSLFV